MYKFSWDIIFVDDQNLGFLVLFLRIICYQPLSSMCIVIVLKHFKDLIFVDDYVTRKNNKNYIHQKFLRTYTVGDPTIW